MKRITASFAGLLLAGLVTVSITRAADEPAKPAAPQPPKSTEGVVLPPPDLVPAVNSAPAASAVTDRYRLQTLLRKRAYLQVEISKNERRLKSDAGLADLHKSIAEIDAKIADLQAQKMKLLTEAEPKLKELYQQLTDISLEIGKAAPPSLPPTEMNYGKKTAHPVKVVPATPEK